jgi:hypothetical protein
MPHTWAALAEMAEKNQSLHIIVAALCRHNQGQPGGAGDVAVSDAIDKPPKAKRVLAKGKKRK